jgi:hypothetical protein
MKIAIATEDFQQLAGHAGQACHWLLYDCQPGSAPPPALRVTLPKTMLFHHWRDDRGLAGHPLDGIAIIVARSAGDSFLRRMQKRGVDVLLTSESDAANALQRVLAGEALADPRWDVSQLLCKLRDVFSSH